MKFIFTLIGVLILQLSLQAQQQDFTISQAVEYAIKNSNAIKINHLEIKRAEQDVKEYLALGLPKINGSVQYQHYVEIPTSFVPAEFFGGQPGTFAELQFGLANSLVGGLSLNTLIFDGSFFTGIKAQKLYGELTKKSIDQTEYQIRQQVTEAYVGVLLARENIKILDKNLGNLDESLMETKAFLENGFIEKLDLDRLELTYDNLVSQKKSLERAVVLTKNLLKFQMNYPLEKEINLTENFDVLIEKALVEVGTLDSKPNYSKRPEYSTILLGQQLNEINYKATRNSRYPSLVGFANYQQQLQRNNLFDSEEPGFTPISIVGLSLNIPIYNGGQVKIKEQKIRLDIEKTEIQKNDFERGVDLQIKNAYQQYLNARESMLSAKKRQTLAENIFDVTSIKYKEGVGSSIEKSQAERDIYAAQQSYMQSLFDLLSSKISLDVATGEINNNKY